MNRLGIVLRYAIFAAMTVSIAAAWTLVAGTAFPRLRLESTRYLLIPMMVISGCVSLPVYAALCRQRDRTLQVIILYGAIAATSMLYGVFLWVTGRDGTPVFVLTALIAGNIFGLPLMLVLVPLHFALARMGFYRRPGG